MRKFAKNKNAYMKQVGALVSLLVVIIIAILVFWQTNNSLPATDSTRTEIFTGYTPDSNVAGVWAGTGSNASAQTVNLTYVPYSTSNSTISVVCFNSTDDSTSSPAITIANRVVTIPASPSAGIGTPTTYDQINVTYTTKIYQDSTQTRTQATTVFQLLPIIAIVVVGMILIGLVIKFGKK